MNTTTNTKTTTKTSNANSKYPSDSKNSILLSVKYANRVIDGKKPIKNTIRATVGLLPDTILVSTAVAVSVVYGTCMAFCHAGGAIVQVLV